MLIKMSEFFINYIIIYFTSCITILGYGYLLINLSKNTNLEFNLGEIGIIGVLFASIYSRLSHIFIPHGYVHNVLFLLIGLFFFFYFFRKNFKKDFIVLIIIFVILFISFPTFKSHDDFPYYHFPYTYYLTQYPNLYGLGNLNHGFRTPSSIFYINSLFYLPFFSYYLFNLAAVLILGFFNLSIILKIINIFKKKVINQQIYFLISILIFVNIFFYRIPEHGTDRSAQILISILFFEYFLMIINKSNIFLSVKKILIYISLIISFKSFYVLYVIFIPGLIYFLYDKNNLFIFKNFFKLKDFYFNLFLLSFLLTIFGNFSNTGCLLYPISFTCFDNFSWSIPVDQVEKMQMWYEQWSKAGATPNFRVENPEIYIQKFNWVSNWIDMYFFNKFSDFLLGLLFILTMMLSFFYKRKKDKILINNHYVIFYICILILFFEWFYNHPSLRYGGFVLVFSIIFLPLNTFLSAIRSNRESLKVKSILLIFIVALVFEVRNIHRLNKEFKNYNYNFVKNFKYHVDENYFRIDKAIKLKINDKRIIKN